jgi:dGTPase
LNLNEDLTEAIALGHDLGHPAFGHTGEMALSEVAPGGFRHSEQSLRVVETLEKDGDGLNLTYEVKDGILKHSLGEDDFSSIKPDKSGPVTLEGMIVLLSDKIAYINHDIQDAEAAGIISCDQLPKDAIELLGRKSSVRINKMVQAVVEESRDRNTISMKKDVFEATSLLRKYLYENLYNHPKIQKEADKAKRVIEELYLHYLKFPEEPKERFSFLSSDTSTERIVCDHIAFLSDRDALESYKRIFFPTPWIEGD